MFYIVSTPIGNMGDITVRAIETLKNADYIVCEDSRVTAKLLQYHDIKKSMIVYNEHIVPREKILALLKEGKEIALVSDAGTPLISDPGYKLIRALVAEGVEMTSVTGASSVVAALTLSGLPTDKFMFCGFAPKNFAEFTDYSVTLIFFESARRLSKTLANMYADFGNREVAVCKELTKMYEEVVRGSLSELVESYVPVPKGEVVIVVAGRAKTADIGDIDALLDELLPNMSLKSAVDEVASLTNISKKVVYKHAIAKKDQL